MNQLLLRRRADAVSEKKEYAVQCFNPNAENYNPAVSIILNDAGYGKYVDSNDHSKGWYLTKKEAAKVTSFGTIFRNKRNVVDSNGIVSDDTSLSYTFDNFDEIIYFSSVYSLEQYAFDACSSLTGILKIPSWMNCNANFALDIQSTECSILCNHDLDLKKNMRARKILVNGNFAISNPENGCSELRINGTLTTRTLNNVIFYKDFLTLAFIEVANVFTTDNKIYYRTSWQGNYAPLIHLSYFGIATKPSVMRGNDAYYGLPRVLVGDGSSLENDTQVLNLYMQDTDWASTDMSVSIWWNYNGRYKWYYVTNNLTNFTNSNPVEWPYITRNESYNTTIVPTGDTPLNRVMVLMYEAVDDGTTPDNPTDITSQVYNPNTGEISIQSVTGNIIIEEFNEIKLHPTLLDSSRSLYQGHGWPADGYYLVYKYADDSSSGDYRINNSQGSNAYITYFIDCSIIPRNVTILSVECAYNARIDGNYSSTTKLVCGNTVKSEESPTPMTSSIVTMNNAGTWTRSELDSCAIMFSINPNNLQQVKYMWLSGATLTVKYK